MIVYLLFNILSLDVVNGSQIEKNDGNNEVDVIYSPYEKNSSAVLSVDLKDLTNFTVCSAFMVDGLVDVASSPDTATFWNILSSFSICVKYDSLFIEE